MSKKKHNIPTLRFPEFRDDWIEKRTKEIAPLQRGFDLTTSNVIEGKFPVVYSNGVLRYHKEYMVEAPGVTTGRSGTIGKVTYIEENYWPHNTSLWVTDFKGNIPKFIYYFYVNFKLERYNAGSTVPTLNRNDVHFVKKRIPNTEEQIKIATFLTSVDKRIQALEQKKKLLEQYKKGVMQKIFNREIRFQPGTVTHHLSIAAEPETPYNCNDNYPDWEVKTLYKECKFFSGGTPKSTNKNYYNGTIPFIGSGDISNNSVEKYITDEALKNSSAKLVNKGDLLYALYGATSGEVSLSKIDGAINQAVLCIRTNHSNEFLYFLLKYNKNKIVSTFIQGGQGNLSADIIKKLKFGFPCLEEQKKIAGFLSAIDTKIEAVTSQIDHSKTFKKGLLQKMFV